MDAPSSTDEILQEINVGTRAGFDTRAHLEKARRQADERGYDEILIVDADAHHYETESWPDIIKYIENPVIRHRAEALSQGGRSGLMPGAGGNQSNAGRILRYPRRRLEQPETEHPRDVELIRREMQAIGLDYQIVFPTPMLELGMHPDPEIEVELSWAYTRWLTEEILPHDRRMKTMVYLPFNEPGACLRMVEAFSEATGVAGFMVTGARYRPVHHEAYTPVYRGLEERGMTLGFHAAFYSRERMFEGMNRFLSVHALGFVFPLMVHTTNMVINGIPERFPNLKILLIEGGLAWVPFLMQRLDNEYLMRTSEAPLLTKRPSDYLRENFYYATQPLETGDHDALEWTLSMVNAEERVLFSSDYPHWDFNLPSTIYDLPFLSEKAKRKILGENAASILRLES